MEELNTVNDVQELNVEAQNSVEETGEGAAEQVETPEQQPQEAAEPAPRQQTPEENEQFKLVRQRAAQEAEQRAQERFSSKIAAIGMMNPYRDNKPVTSYADLEELEQDQQAADRAATTGASIEDSRKIIEQERQREIELEEVRRKNDELQEVVNQKVRDDDLAAIKAHNPKETVKDVRELGELFRSLRINGVDPVDAYEAVRAINAKKQPPASMGGIGEQAPGNAEYYTEAEVRGMSPDQVRKNLDKIERSMRKW